MNMKRWKFEFITCIRVLVAIFSPVKAINIRDHSVLYSGPTEVHEGFPFSIRCVMNRNDLASWTIDGIEIPPDNDAGYTLSRRALDTFHREMILYGEGAQLYHEGEYRCSGYSRDYHYLHVIKADFEDEDYDNEVEEDEKKQIEMPASHQILEINSTIILHCTSAKDDDTPVHWYKNSRRISSDQDSNIQVTRTHVIIKEAQEDDAGEYMCTVDFPFQTGLTDIGRIFQIKSPARILRFPSRKSVMDGRSLTLECIFQGFPSPKITWYKDNFLVTNLMKFDSRIWMYASSAGQQKAYLTIKDITNYDKGIYTCRAENTLDGITVERDEQSSFVHIRENMIETNEDEPGVGKLLVPGKDLVLQCNTTECPQCRVVWYKDDRLINGGDRIKIQDDANSVVIEQATYDDSGTYTCAIDRKQLDIALNATISVYSEIKLEKFDASSNIVVEGHTLELICLAKGSPKPFIKWFKGNELISKSDKRIKILEHADLKDSKLLIEEADYGDRDHYTCEAYNQISSFNTTIFIRVKDRLAALWPFLGICLEVIILCSIIFFYERRKNDQSNENGVDLPSENRNTHDQKAAERDLRHRK